MTKLSDGIDLPEGSDLQVALVRKEGCEVDDLVAELKEIDGVELAAPNYRRQTALVPNDLFFQRQYGMQDSAAGISLPASLDRVVDTGSSSEANIVAVLDTGVDYTHPDLRDVMWSDPGDLGLPSSKGAHGYDVADQDSDPMPSDYFAASHGTHCAGVVAASTNNGEGVAGTAQRTEIMAIKMSPDSESSGSFSDIDLIAGYSYVIQAAMAGENVVAVSGSWHVGPYSPVIDYAINQAGKAGVMSILAAGNDGIDLDDSVNNGATVHIESPYAIVVAASDRDNELAAFSNWNAVDVDIAAPGAYSLSSVSTGAGAAFFNAELSHEAGKDLSVYADLADLYSNGDLSISVINAAAGNAPLDQELVDRALSLSVTDEGKLKVSLDLSQLPPAAPGSYRLIGSWESPNPFKGSSRPAEEYAASISMELESGSAGYIQVRLSDSEGVECLSDQVGVQAVPDNSIPLASSGGQTVVATSDADDVLSARFMLLFAPDAASPEASCVLGGFGVGVKDEAYVPYGYMSGTSMATPMIAGAYAQLASSFPQETPLELRGRLLGSTDPLSPSAASEGAGKSIATDGRFTFDAAFDDSLLNATSWGVEADVDTGEVVLHGRALDGASLSVDGSPVDTEMRQDGFCLAFKLDASYFDGGLHRFDLVDGMTGRTHQASYSLPKRQDAGLVKATELASLPVSAQDASQGALIASTDTLYYADRLGSFLYSFDPSDPGASWKRLSAPGRAYAATPGADVDAMQTSLSYLYLDGKIHALGFDARAGKTGDDLVLFHAEYDVASDTWSDYTEVARIAAPYFGELSIGRVIPPAAYDGSIEFAVVVDTSVFGSESHALHRFEFAGDEGGWTETKLPLDGDGPLPLGFTTTDGLRMLSVGADGASEVRLILEDGSWGEPEDVAGFPELSESLVTDLFKAPQLATGTGLMVAGRPLSGHGNMTSFDVAGSAWRGIGTLSVGTSTSPVVGSGAMMGDVVYLCALDIGGSSSGQGSLVALDRESTSYLGSMSGHVRAVSEEGGSAHVSDWRSVPSDATSIRLHDRATWVAKADQGYRFDGWYDQTGELVSSDATMAAPVLGDATLTARFTLVDESAGGDMEQPDDAGPEHPRPGLGGLPGTGDPTLALVGIVAVVGLAAILGAAWLHRR